MTHKVHPKAYRLKESKDWNSRWLNEKKLALLLEEDFKIRKFLEKKLADCFVEKIEIERLSGQTNVVISTSRPGLIIGRGGKGIEILKNELESKVLKEKKGLRLEIRGLKNLWVSASLVAQWMASQIEKRVPYRRVLKRALSNIMASKEVKGARLEVAGRLGGTLIARREWLGEGRIPRQTLRAEIDYGTAQAFCTYGVVGVKVWIYKGEKLE